MSDLAARVFGILVGVVSETTKYNFTMPVDYEGCKILIRPFEYTEVIMVSGLWEPPVKEILEANVRKSEVVVDIGANVGVYAIPLAKLVNNVIAFEQNPKTNYMLEKSIELNQLQT